MYVCMYVCMDGWMAVRSESVFVGVYLVVLIDSVELKLCNLMV